MAVLGSDVSGAGVHSARAVLHVWGLCENNIGSMFLPPSQEGQYGCSLDDYVLGLYKDNGKENGNYYIIVGYT